MGREAKQLSHHDSALGFQAFRPHGMHQIMEIAPHKTDRPKPANTIILLAESSTIAPRVDRSASMDNQIDPFLA